MHKHDGAIHSLSQLDGFMERPPAVFGEIEAYDDDHSENQ